MAIEVRIAKSNDLNFIYDLLKETSIEMGTIHRFSQSKESLRRNLFSEKKIAEALIGEINSFPVGLCLFSLTHRNFTLFSQPGIFVHNVCVNKEYRRCGVAKALMEEIKRIAQERDCDRIDGVLLKGNEGGAKFLESLDVQEVSYIRYMRHKL